MSEPVYDPHYNRRIRHLSEDCDCCPALARLRRRAHELEAANARLQAQVGFLMGVISDVREGRA